MPEPAGQQHDPVAVFQVQLLRTAHGVVATGWAAPARGRLPCVLHLRAGPALLAVAKATRYSAEAAARGVRLGWCGFRVGDLSAGAALAEEVTLACAVSGAVQARWGADDVADRAEPAGRPVLTVPEYQDALARVTGCEDPETILPFARRLYRLRGDMELVAACYRWVLQRSPATTEIREFIKVRPEGALIEAALNMLMGSEEYALRPRYLSGPFDGDFPFDAAALDEG